MAKVVRDILIDRDKLDEMCRRLGKQITEDYTGKNLVMIGVLKGAFIFMADLIRYINLPLRVDFMSVSSYGSGTRSSGIVKILKDIDQDISGCDVLVVEDIVDTGLTLNKLIELLATRNPTSIHVCAAFDKPSRRIVTVDIRYCGMSIPDEFVVGYGLDYNNTFRNLPDLCLLGDDN
ncbi:MAG: hypoxanthine phosphoribosyltransferase [Clostridiaceae bacterium]|nr:hypoxanthine phosphoribosyltransferase [Clostridiaceae bacterium]